MGGIHHIMLDVEDDEDPGPMKEPPAAYCRIDVIGGVATLTHIPLGPNGEELPNKTQFSVSAYSLARGVQALMDDEANGEPEEWASRHRQGYASQ